jgi:hypothetical protein
MGGPVYFSRVSFCFNNAARGMLTAKIGYDDFPE